MASKEGGEGARIAAPVPTAVIGAGYWGKNYVRNLSALDAASLLWVCDQDERALSRACRFAPSARPTPHLGQVLQDPHVHAAVIATNANLHYEHARAALLAGKHVLVEKPMTTEVSEAEDLGRIAQEAGLILMVGHLMLYHPAVGYLLELVRSGELGRIYYLSSSRVNLGRIRQDENALWSFGPHDLSMIRCLLGADPVSVSARGQSYLRPGVEDVVFVNLGFADDIMAQIQLSWLDPRKERRLTIVGSRKMVVFDDMHPTDKLRIYDKGFERPPDYESFGDYLLLRSGDTHIPHLDLSEPLAVECSHFLHCVATGEPPRTGAEDGLAIVRALTAAEHSMRAGGTPMAVP